MPRPFTRLDLDEFADLVASFPFHRRITAVHLHHTWRPRQADFRGLATIEGMWRFHTEENNWSDIAQHLTIDPQGGIWTGRSWNVPPASAKGFNGVSSHGPFMIEMIGDFDRGRESLTDAQKKSVLGVLARLHLRHGLHPETLRFHNQMSAKSCPGSSISHTELVAELAAEIERLAAQPRKASRSLPFGADMLEAAQRSDAVIRTLLAGDGLGEDPADAELAESEAGPAAAAAAAGRGARGDELTPEIIDALRPHVINLRQGAFSGGGHFETTKEDVDTLVHERLAEWYRDRGDLRLMLYAHGGLTSEKKALLYAHQSFEFWKDNGVYPIYFVWETGLTETIGQLLKLAWDRIRGRRDIFDISSDLAVENLARALGGVKIWSGMKRAAEKAADAGGGGLYFAEQLREFIGKLDPKPVRKLGIHAAGHSAGSIFHSHLLPQLFLAKGPAIQSVHFLAPAVQVELFKEKLAQHVGGRKKVRRLTLYTMRKSLERADHTGHVYRKSLLYLVHRVLENRRKTPILGLEKSLRRDRELVDLFGLSGGASDGAEIIWSTTDADSGLDASRSTSHGGFDNDPPTMNSVLRRVLGVDDMAPIHDFKDYPAAAAARDLDGEPLRDLLDPEALEHFDFDERGEPAPATGGAPVAPAPPPAAAPPGPTTAAPTAARAGQRRALCVGINDYPTAPLRGCVRDSQTWAQAFRAQGFEVTSLTDGQATRGAILAELGRLIDASGPGDVVLFQYAGHGTRMPDLNGDEPDGKDEAMVPFDYQQGAYLLDDDLGKLYDTVPPGVNLTTFIDCCHSGSINRMLPGGDLRQALHSGPVRMRFMPVDDLMVAAHKSYRSARALEPPGADHVGREVHFGACQDDQSAWESNGQGDFTRAAAPLLAQAVAGGWTHAQLQARLEAAFAGNQRQKPNLVADDARRNAVVLAPEAAAAPPPAPAAGASPEIQALLQKLMQLLASGRA